MVLFKSTALISVIQTLRYLHSTMVLFKSLSIKIFLFRSQFTFHYGPIQIATVNNFKDNVAKFTFHYGPIQMRCTHPHLALP